jgi:hypothetical protein
VKEGEIPETLLFSEIDAVKDSKDFIGVEEADQRLLSAFLRDIEDGICQFPLIRIHEADHFGERFEGSEAIISCSWEVSPFPLQIVEKSENEFGTEVFKAKGFDLNLVIFCSEGEEDFKSMTIAIDGIVAHSLDMREVVEEELMD